MYTLNIPDDVLERAQEIARDTARPVNDVLLSQLKGLMLPALPLDEQAELDALEHLADDTLWTIAREQLPLDIRLRMGALMDSNSAGDISDAEYGELSDLVERGNRLTLRKARASALLTQRGNRVTMDNLAPADD